MLLGCIADDFTGAADLANNLTRGGMRSFQTVGVPAAPLAADTDAVARSRAALDWLRRQGCRQVCFKYCSTFGSMG